MCQIIVKVLIKRECKNCEERKMRQKPKQAKDLSSEWRSCIIHVWSPLFNGWIRQNGCITIKPGQSVSEAEQQYANDNGIPVFNVIFSPTLDAE
jgi:hypothetical protein